jgi:hypothetical protein
MAETLRNESSIKPETLRAAIDQFGCENVLGWFQDEAIRRLIREMGEKDGSR